MKPFSYSGSPPIEYRCSECDASGCKLWRPANEFGHPIYLLCSRCVLSDQGLEGPINEFGQVHEPVWNVWTDIIGGRMPAIPEEDGDEFWGYRNTPPEAYAWWRGLPTRWEI